jgi:hypothetical protein
MLRLVRTKMQVIDASSSMFSKFLHQAWKMVWRQMLIFPCYVWLKRVSKEENGFDTSYGA